MKDKEPVSLPFANTMGDSFDLMKKMWGMAGLPGMSNAGNLATMAMRLPQQLPSMVAPTLDVNELDKRIADLRAVEAWLELNSSMLRTTIQTLEVQRATIATLKGMSAAMLAPLTKAGQKPDVAGLPPNAFAMPPMPQMPAPEEPGAARKSARKRHKAKVPHPPTVADAPLNPTAWWNTLQDQFTKIAATAAAGAATPAKKPGKASSIKRAGKTGKST
ncbi:MAG: PhaM family polyhydroxyalkanoate granule multifunctional regulatory protein [Burkholderiaceae bacterium]